MDENYLERREEELRIDKELGEVGSVRARKLVENRPYDELVTRDVEQAEIEREPAAEGDSGQVETLPDGSVSIPVLEEELVVTKRVVVRERIVIRKRTVTEEQRVSAELRRERVELDTDGDVEVLGAEGDAAA
jgi:uncharacterized protein (TIGR02271 family)